MRGQNLVRIFILIMIKCVLSAILNRVFLSSVFSGLIDTNVDNPAELENFAFLYGTFPTASAAFVFATQYDACTDIMASGGVIVL